MVIRSKIRLGIVDGRESGFQKDHRRLCAVMLEAFPVPHPRPDRAALI